MPFVFPRCSPTRSETETGPELSEPAGADRALEAVLADGTNVWLARPGVTGTAPGACDGAPCIVIYVTDERLRRAFPTVWRVIRSMVA